MVLRVLGMMITLGAIVSALDGNFTIVRAVEPRLRLSLVPEHDQELRELEEKGAGKNACSRCGHDAEGPRCDGCGRTRHEPAVL